MSARTAAVWVGAALAACQSGEEQGAYAERVRAWDQLIGGPGALGAVGDYLLGNQHFRVIVQDKGWSRGFGVFGGGIIDADLVRPNAPRNDDGRVGYDNFGELFPVLLFSAFDVDDQYDYDGDGNSVLLPAIEIVADGSAGGAAILRTRARPGDFLSMASEIGAFAVPATGLLLETDYIVRPGSRHVEIVGRIKNVSNLAINLPVADIGSLGASLGIDDLQIPAGDVALFGGGNRVFVPGAVGPAVPQGDPRVRDPRPVGFDVQQSLQAAYEHARSLPALPGLVADFLATSGPQVSYGIAAGDSPNNFVWNNREQYERDAHVEATPHAIIIPFLASSFTGFFYETPPNVMQPGDVYEYRKYFLVGSGDVASIRDELYRVRGTPTGRLSGRVVNAVSGEPEGDAEVHVLDYLHRPYSQVKVQADGYFTCALESGRYHYVVTAPGRYPYPGVDGAALDSTALEMTAGGAEYRHVRLPEPARLVVDVRDEHGRPLPAKVSLVARYGSAFDGVHPENYLYNLWLGEDLRATDYTWVEAQPRREYVEQVLWVDGTRAPHRVRPTTCAGAACAQHVVGHYDVYVSRGPEYELQVVRQVALAPGEQRALALTLRRVVDTSDYVSADLHVHGVNSLDSIMDHDSRILSAAAEGVEVVVSTDHNYVTDYRPTIQKLGLSRWVQSVVGVELTTVEMGHFNGFPMRLEAQAPTHLPFVDHCYEPEAHKANGTAFDWVQCAPGQIFANMRALAAPGADFIVQVNHPRDTILGYFNQFYLNTHVPVPEAASGDNAILGGILAPESESGQYRPESFSFDFDAIEVFNAKRLDLLHDYVLPEDAEVRQPGIVARLRDPCRGGHPDNGPGRKVLATSGRVLHPGAVDDWLRLLNHDASYRFIATGNSDSHNGPEEIGAPRTYFYVGPAPDGARRDEVLEAVTPGDLARGLKGRRVFTTNGPMLELTVVTAGGATGAVVWNMGSTVRYAQSNRNLPVDVYVRVRSAPWVYVDEVALYANGARVAAVRVPRGSDDDNIFKMQRADGGDLTFDRDTVLVAEAVGTESLFPVVTPKEVPPTNLSQALGSLSSSLDLDLGSAGGDLSEPRRAQKMTPYALTNPIWLDIDADGDFDAPGNPPPPANANPPTGACSTPSAVLVAQRPDGAFERLLRPLGGAGKRIERSDVRRLFQMYGHVPGHGH